MVTELIGIGGTEFQNHTGVLTGTLLPRVSPASLIPKVTLSSRIPGPSQATRTELWAGGEAAQGPGGKGNKPAGCEEPTGSTATENRENSDGQAPAC